MFAIALLLKPFMTLAILAMIVRPVARLIVSRTSGRLRALLLRRLN